ncbi:hypothetical protein [Arthrobacter sp. efr-133-TYG-120]|uniref:hypothetical protein n=1 Tax=Arthrobacter sp. efr-133-TYG-120 TaxID=3040280 RepID=UPI0025517B6B|nr:hypothetical protein [Arthrobacter sp. efr-133-TYG-120]
MKKVNGSIILTNRNGINRPRFTFVALALGLLLISAAPTAVAAPVGDTAEGLGRSNNLTASDEARIRASFNEFNVGTAQQDKLIKKLRAGQPLDAFTGVEPVLVEDRSTRTKEMVIERFADGSFKAQSVERPLEAASASVTLRAVITNCSYSGGSGYAVYSGCSIAANWSGIINVAFVATYQHVNGGPSSILSVGNSTQNCAGVSCSSPTVWIGRGTSIGTTPAWAQAQSRVQAAWGSWEVWVQLQVRPYTATVSQS